MAKAQAISQNATGFARALFNINEECPYKNDWPWRLVVAIARILEVPFRGSTSRGISREPSPLTIGLVIFLFYDLVAIINAVLADAMSPHAGGIEVPLFKDYAAWVIAIIFPLAAMIGFSFYRNVFPTINRLQADKVITEKRPDAILDFKAALLRKFNSVAPQSFFAFLALLITYFHLTRGPQTIETGWVNELNLGVQVWLILVSFLAYFSTFYFVWKCLIFYLAWRQLLTKESVYGLNLKPRHPDGCGGFGCFTSLWLRIHYIMVLLGVFIFTWSAFWGQWSNPSVISAVIAYAVLAPTLFVAPFIPIHREMVRFKHEKIAKAAQLLDQLEKSFEDGIDSQNEDKISSSKLVPWATFYFQASSEAKKYPTWPWSMHLERFTASYLVPFGIFAIGLKWG